MKTAPAKWYKSTFEQVDPSHATCLACGNVMYTRDKPMYCSKCGARLIYKG